MIIYIYTHICNFILYKNTINNLFVYKCEQRIQIFKTMISNLSMINKENMIKKNTEHFFILFYLHMFYNS